MAEERESHGGWIAVYRSMLDPFHDLHPHSTGSKACDAFAWIDLVGLAFWKDHGGIRRGQLRASQRFLCTRWNWSRSRVQRFLARLEDQGMIIRAGKASREPDRITICNYDTYQDVRSTNRTTDGSANGSKEEQEQEPQPNNHPTALAIQEVCTAMEVAWDHKSQPPAEWAARWQVVYPRVDLKREALSAANWLSTSAEKKRSPSRFLLNWLKRAHASLPVEQDLDEAAETAGEQFRQLLENTANA